MSIRNRLDERALHRQLRIAYRYFSAGRLGIGEVKSGGNLSTIKMVDEIAGLLLKLMPLVPVLGGFFLLRYLHYINRPELFISSIASLPGLVALLLGGVLVLLLFAITLMAPWGLLSYVLMERAGNGLWKAKVWKVMATFFVFPASALIIAMLGISVPFEIYKIMGLVYLFSLLTLLPVDKPEAKIDREEGEEKDKGFWQQCGWIFLLSLGMSFAALLCSMPIVVLMRLADSEAVQIILVMGYVIFSAILGMGLSKVKDWKIWTIFGGAVLLIVILYMNGPVLSGAAKFLGIRHDDARWYSIVDSDKTQAVLPESIRRSADGNYIFAATPFSFGENVVVCNSEQSKIVLVECVTLDRSEVRLSGKEPSKTK